jgi:stress response protein YsnF
VEETHEVSGTVRREEARIEQDGDVDPDHNR